MSCLYAGAVFRYGNGYDGKLFAVDRITFIDSEIVGAVFVWLPSVL